MTQVLSTNPTTGETTPTGVDESSALDVVAATTAAFAAAPALGALDLTARASLLDAIAAALEADGDAIVATADGETALGSTRLAGELRRTCFQFRFFADVVRDGAFLEASVDHARDTPMGPLPDLRRQLEPLGPVGVFGASNFPLAFSVPGGDTASALAAGCPVVVKVHSAHPATSRRVFAAMDAALRTAGAPEGTLSLVYGRAAGVALVEDPRITAVGFTGSYGGGRALFNAAQARPAPIPFYGELGSVNPLVVTPQAASARAVAIGEGLAGSVTLGSGQFCTRPGFAFVPAGPDGDALVAAAGGVVAGLTGATMLTSAIRDSFEKGVNQLLDVSGVDVVARSGVAASAAGAEAVLVATDLETLTGPDRATLETECFGAVTIFVRYSDPAELLKTLANLEPALTFSVHAEADDALGAALVAVGRSRAGRVVVNGYPTGVGVSWSMHHGGPHPATTNPLHTSVGASAMRRWLRPVCYQGTPDAWLPPALREANPWGVPRRVDGVMQP
jgi:NADP-dependent aldehyde dehydrogenase